MPELLQAPSSTRLAGFPALVARAPDTRRRPPVVFLHGAFGDHTSFAGLVRFFADAGYDAHAAAHRGRAGVGPEPPVGVRIEDYLEDSLAVIDAVGGRPVVIGHSLGGLLAQKIAEEDRCAAAVLLAPAPAGMLTAQPRSLPTFLPQLPRILSGRPFLVDYEGAARVALNRVPEPERRAIHAGLVPESGAAYRQMLLGTVRVDAGRVRCPVLCVGGGEDRVISRRLLRSTARRYGAELRVYPGHAHWLIEEPGWERIAGDVLDWLDRVLPRGS